MSYLLFTTSSCVLCPQAKEYLTNHGVNFDTHVIDENDDSMNLAIKYKVIKVPSLLIINGEEIVKRYNTLSEIVGEEKFES